MQHFSEILPLQQQVLAWKKQGVRVGFVPTMGNLHAGHLSLVEMAKQQADKVVASVFVNPLQFGPNEDFEHYPRTLDEDAEKLQQIGCDALFAPSVQEMYPEGVLQTRVCAAPSLANRLEGALRPGHFDGVTTVVAKLFHIVQPDLAVFGQKDFQQYLVIEKMVSDLSFPVQLIRAPIARAPDGLALSSRNQYLTPEQRAIAPKLYQILQALGARLEALKSVSKEAVEVQLQAAQQDLLAAGFDQVDYIQLLEAKTLQPCKSLSQGCVLLAVARLGQTRLLDNLLIN